jgi:hypothetical protein
LELAPVRSMSYRHTRYDDDMVASVTEVSAGRTLNVLIATHAIAFCCGIVFAMALIGLSYGLSQ